MHLLLRAASALVAGAVLAASCRPAPAPHPPPQVLRVALAAAPSSLDPALGRSSIEAELGRLYTEPLLEPGPGLAGVAPGAASNFDVSPDGLVYTFHLRPGGAYDDGRPVVAADFVGAWRRLIDPRTAAPAADLFAGSVAGGLEAHALQPDAPPRLLAQDLAALGLGAPDPRTFQVRLARPEGWFPWVATLWQGAPVPAGLAGPGSLVTNGPFRVAGVSAAGIRLVANPHYGPARPRLREVDALVVPDPAERLRLYRQGRLDLTQVPEDATAAVESDPRLRREVIRQPLLTEYWLDFNLTRPPFDDLRLRVAVARSLDRGAYVAGSLHGQALPATTLVPAGMPGHDGDLGAGQSSDPARARAALAAAGGAGRLAGMRLMTLDSPAARAAAGFVAAQVETTLGVRPAIDAVTPVEFGRRVSDGDFQLAVPQGWQADYPDPQDWFDLFLSSSGNDWSGWRDPRYDGLVAAADGARAAGERLRLYRQADILLAGAVPAAFLDQVMAVGLEKPYLRGVITTPLDAPLFLGGLHAAGIWIAPH